jgi:Glycosyl hydrolases family 15
VEGRGSSLAHRALRDATLTLLALMGGGYHEEAQAWRDWLHRSIAGNADELQIMYGVRGERHLLEWEADWLPGYQRAKPVRIGNVASEQLQLDVYGEVMDALHQARAGGLDVPPSAWSLQANMIEHLETIWQQPDDGFSCIRKSWRGSLLTGWCKTSSNSTFQDRSNIGVRLGTLFMLMSALKGLMHIRTASHKATAMTIWTRAC